LNNPQGVAIATFDIAKTVGGLPPIDDVKEPGYENDLL
jgi:hypothetical protein